MPPDAPKLIVAYHMIPSHPQRIRNFPLLFHREEDIALDSEDQGRCARKGPKALCEFR